jgi:linoleoyl-CoA desaturase
LVTEPTAAAGLPRAQRPLKVHQLKFGPRIGFDEALKRRVEQYFTDTGLPQRDCPQMYVKSAILLAAFVGVYVVLVFLATAWWQAVPLAILLGLCSSAIGFNVQHDGGHGGYSNSKVVNKLAAMTLDLMGGSSYMWARKHNAFHHTYSNIDGHDDDINLGILGRLSPHQPRLAFHRAQHFYLWFLYGFLPAKWHVIDDFRDWVRGRIGEHPIQRPRRWDLVIFLGGKALFFTLAWVIPMLFHPWWVVLGLYFAATYVQGIVLSVVFQLAHCVEEAEFPEPRPDTGRMEHDWAVHQVETTVDFGQKNRLLSWLIGGLNFQIEHHLFPHICHVHYPALAPVVAETCREYGLRYNAQPTFRAGLASHYRWLRRMGLADLAAR